MQKIEMAGAVVEMDGGELTRPGVKARATGSCPGTALVLVRSEVQSAELPALDCPA